MKPATSSHDKLPAGSFLAASFALAFAASMLFGETAFWSIGTLYACIAVRIVLRTFDWPLPSQALKLFILAIGSASVLASYGSIVGIEAGLGILVILVALKLLETNSLRDFQVLVLLGYFLALCDLFFVQDLAHWLYIAVIVAVLTIALVRNHQGSGTFRSVRVGFTIALQALPIIVLLYLFFPRIYGGFRIRFSNATQSSNAMSDRMEPGSIASLALHHGRAFRVRFPDGNMPSEAELYWRGVVLWRGEGLTWVRSGQGLSPDRLRQSNGPEIHQQIILEPHGETWLFALDRPSRNPIPGGANFEAGGCLRTLRAIVFPLAYDAYSRLENHETWIPADQRRMATLQPSNVSPEVQALVESWRAGGADPHLVIRRALNFFRTNGFQYTLTPGVYSTNNALDDFLFRRRIGFCEHYAGAFATLMRIAGLPSRVVLGYHGGSFDGNLVEVNQADAHAWCEVWLKDEGWERVDPTSVIAPDRINQGMEWYLARAQASLPGKAGTASTGASWWRWADGARLVWDNLSYQWDLRVMNYDTDEQRTLLATLGLAGHDWNRLLFGLGAIIAILLGAIGLFITRPSRRQEDPAVQCFGHFCRLLAKVGITREPWEGPLDYSNRAARERPTEAEHILKVGDLYTRARYGRTAVSLAELAQAVRDLAGAMSSSRPSPNPPQPDPQSSQGKVA